MIQDTYGGPDFALLICQTLDAATLIYASSHSVMMDNSKMLNQIFYEKYLFCDCKSINTIE